MINGEEGGEVESDLPLPDPLEGFAPWLDQRSEAEDDDGDSHASSGYSSCGESELERYCSANSALGTGSFCSSVGTCNEFLDTDLWSLKNLGFANERVLESIDSHEKSGCNYGDGSVATVGRMGFSEDGRTELQNEDIGVVNGASSVQEEKNSWRNEDSLSSRAIHLQSRANELIRAEVGKNQSADANMLSQTGVNIEDDMGSLGISRCQNGSESPSLSLEKHSALITGEEHANEDLSERGCDGSPMDMALSRNSCNKVGHSDSSSFQDLNLDSHEERNSSRYEHSDDDGSMYDGTDDEFFTGSPEKRNMQYVQSSIINNENPLLINSSVAFGGNDWAEFERETEENKKASILLDEPHKQELRHPDFEKSILEDVHLAPMTVPYFGRSEQEVRVRDIPIDACQLHDSSELLEDLDVPSVTNLLTGKQMSVVDGDVDRELQWIRSEEVTGTDESGVPEYKLSENLRSQVHPISSQTSFSAMEEFESKKSEDHDPITLPQINKDDQSVHPMTLSTGSLASVDFGDFDLPPIRMENHGSKESYDEVVLEMEEILLDSREFLVARLPQSKRGLLSQQSHEYRDGSSTASTSGADDTYSPIEQPLKIHGVEVIGAKQKKGDVSLGERLVGVKEYTVYVLKVWSSKDQWEVERRYRDFVALYRQLKAYFANNGWTLPQPWSRVERESRKIFGNVSPDVVSERSALIQECLRSVLHYGSHYSLPSSLIWFLSSQDILSRSSTLNTLVTQSSSASRGASHSEDVSSFGKTISLHLEIQPRKSMQQLLEAQHYACAGCHKHLDAGKNLMQGFVQTLGWGTPRLCEYTSQLFCSSCHTKETAVLPARVLHFWDFTEYSVSQLAKSYLESIYDKPMLCVGAVNPFLFSKVPALRHIMAIRKKISAMVPFVQCPFRRSLLKRVGTRRYLLENNEFFALRDLVDLSKAAFAALPGILDTLSKKILEHITQRCLVCCDLGVPCGARQACEDPSALIFPFQEDVIKRCSSCELAFHKQCIRCLSHCPCGATLEGNVGESMQLVSRGGGKEAIGDLNSSASKSSSSSAVGFLSNLFSKSKQVTRDPRHKSPVILMGSLPNTSF